VIARILVSLTLAASLCGCASNWETNPPTTESGGIGVAAGGQIEDGQAAAGIADALPKINSTGALPPYGASGEAAAYEYGTGYRIGAGDRLTIRVNGQPDLTTDYIVDGSGNISMPLIRTVRVGGLTTVEVEDVISQRLRNGYLRTPSVSVQATNLRPFYILGEVNQAGSFPYQSGMTVQNAVAIAGGYGTRADQGPVMLTRKAADGTRTYKVPVTTQLYPGDIVYVRERWF